MMSTIQVILFTIVGILAISAVICVVLRITRNQCIQRGEVGPITYHAKGTLIGNEYKFTYRRVNGIWRAYINSLPDKGYERLRADEKESKQKFLEFNPYVYMIKPMYSFDDIKQYAERWADSL